MLIKQKLYVVENLNCDGKPGLSWCQLTGSTTLGEVEVEVDFDMPSDIEVRDLKVSSLQSDLRKVRADSLVKVQRIEDAIQRLMAITND